MLHKQCFIGTFNFQRDQIIHDSNQPIDVESLCFSKESYSILHVILVSICILESSLRAIHFKQFGICGLFVRTSEESCDQNYRLEEAVIWVYFVISQVSDLIIFEQIFLTIKNWFIPKLRFLLLLDLLDFRIFLLHFDLFVNVFWGGHVHEKWFLNLDDMLLELVVI